MFTDRLELSLTLTIQGTAFTIPSGNVKSFDLDLASHGFSGAVEFVVANAKTHGGAEADALLASFLAPDLVTVSLGVSVVHDDPEASSSLAPVTVVGLGQRKTLTEQATRVMKDRPVLYRRYRIEFADPAAVLWKQHFPCALYTEKSVQDVIEANKGDAISLTYDSTTLGVTRPLVFLHLDPTYGSSFYDLVLWYLDANAGVWAYDYPNGAYKISDAKDASGTASSLFGDDAGLVTIVLPEVPRASAAVLSSYTASPQNKPVSQAQAASGIRRDYLMRSAIAQDVDDRVTLETKRLFVRSSELEIAFRRFPTITIHPGVLIQLEASALWSSEASSLAATWRVRRYRIEGRAEDQGADADHDAPNAGYRLAVTARLEQQDDPYVELPAFTAPTYPGYVEGKVVSEQGEAPDVTYQFYTDEATSLDSYKVTVPLWDNQTITAPFAPTMGSGNLYLPAYRDARVLLAIGLTRASIAQLLDWRADAKLAMDVQGEQIFFGKSATNSTAISHAYDGENPVLKVARIHDKDTATLQIKEGSLIITVKEDS
ncbi:hypothetical protein WME99_12550 [Sorangium sp. So ce136]|uniref:hypothetical protein n=1 Tax=Sorangium sp. So ce136 TaxID=3133284 RepID=UPI003EFFE218